MGVNQAGRQQGGGSAEPVLHHGVRWHRPGRAVTGCGGTDQGGKATTGGRSGQASTLE